MAEEKYKVKIGDKEEEVSLEELIKGYQRQSDYTQKTQALSEKEKKYQEELQNLKKELEQYKQDLDDWNRWYLSLEQSQDFENPPEERYYEKRYEEGKEPNECEEMIKRELKALETRLRKEAQEAFKTEARRTQRLFEYIYNLGKLRDYHQTQFPEKPFEWDRLSRSLYARQNPDPSWEDYLAAYSDVYKDLMVERELEKRMKEKEQIEAEKRKAEMMELGRGTPGVTTFFRPPEKAPSSIQERKGMASAILKERLAERRE